jgi:hypothetical protein
MPARHPAARSLLPTLPFHTRLNLENLENPENPENPEN